MQIDLKTKLLLSIYKDKSYIEFFRKVAHDYADDLQQYIAEFIMGLKPEFFNQFENNNKFRGWVHSIAYRSCNFNSCDFYREHFRRKQIDPEDLQVEEYDFAKDISLLKVEAILAKYEREHKDNWYDVMMLRKFIEYGGGYGAAKEISRRTGIPYSSVQHSLTFIRKEVKRRYENINSM